MMGPVESDIRTLAAERTAFGITGEVLKLGLYRPLHAKNPDDIIAIRTL